MAIVEANSAGGLSLSPYGIERNKALLARARAIEERNLSGLSKADIAGCRRVLSHLIARGEASSFAGGPARTDAAE
jgi:hypothetical protein